MRAVPEVDKIAAILADACAAYAPIDRALSEVKESSAEPATRELGGMTA